MAVHPVVLWAQRSSESEPSKNIVYLTIQVQDPINVKTDLTTDTLTFSAQSADKATDYELQLKFFGEIDLDNTHKTETGSHISFVLRKKEAQAEFWPRLLKEKLKLHYIKTDFDKWVDEDEQEEQDAEDPGMGGMGGMPDMSALGGMGGMGGPGGMDFSQLLANAGGAGGAGSDFDISDLAGKLGKNAGAEADEEEEDEDVEEIE